MSAGGLQSRTFEAEPVVSISDRLAQAQYVDKHAPRFCRLLFRAGDQQRFMKVLATSLMGTPIKA